MPQRDESEGRRRERDAEAGLSRCVGRQRRADQRLTEECRACAPGLLPGWRPLRRCPVPPRPGTRRRPCRRRRPSAGRAVVAACMRGQSTGRVLRRRRHCCARVARRGMSRAKWGRGEEEGKGTRQYGWKKATMRARCASWSESPKVRLRKAVRLLERDDEPSRERTTRARAAARTSQGAQASIGARVGL